MSDTEKLQLAATGVSLLYVEDNESLRVNATKLFQKFFKDVYIAEDGVQGLELFKKHRPQIVVSDILMPNMDGMELAKNIKHIAPDTKLMFMSAHDEKNHLYESIAVGIFRFLKKPVNLSELTKALFEAIVEIKNENKTKLFYIQLKNIFNYQSSMVVMVNDEKPLIANQVFLDFFGEETIEDFSKKYVNIGKLFLEHDGFLYNHDDINCLSTLTETVDKLYHVKMKNIEGDIRHLIVKAQKVPEKENYYIISFEDVTELNLLKLFDEKRMKNDENLKDKESMFKLLTVILRNNAKMHIHNYYKGLSITNDGLITDITDDKVTLKTNFLQQKAMQYERKCLLVSEALPHAILCEKVVNISFEKQNVELKALRFVTTSAISRKTIRVVPLEGHTVSLFVDDAKFQGDAFIEDISLDAVKINLNALPAGMVEGKSVIIDMVLELDKRPLIINTRAHMFRKIESRHSFSVVFMFELQSESKSNLVKYITKRQMAIIREFKGLQNG
jgi:YesN/AraC family two-component response regulator